MRRMVFVATAFAAVAAAAGCGATSEPEEQPRHYSAAEVVQQFKTEPGSPRLRKAAGADAAWEQLGLGLNVSERLLRRYGVFTIYVVEPGNDEAVDSLLSDKATGKPLQPDARGIYWELDTQSNDYVAYSKYGTNVVLAWFGGTTEPQVDVRWQRLDRLMGRLALG
ncbi:MAG: hypothetical protein M3265_07615 [Actinomycetota bacterium]|nr:hypothetical protein [Actinomycetota bacterium]